MCQKPIKITVKKKNGDIEEVKVKCGKCFTCQKERSQAWAIKLINENYYHRKKSFITLTFDNAILLKGNKYGANPSFVFHIDNSKKYFQKFMKRLRKHYKDRRITYFRVSEYGEVTKRPHIHVILWGTNFEEDRQKYKKSKSGYIQYISPTLQKLWDCGICTIQDINNNNTIYTAQYVIKKQHNEKRYQPKISFSNKSKIGIKWARRNYKEIAKGYLKEDNKFFNVPRTYSEQLKNSDRIDHVEAYRKFEEKQQEYLEKIPEKERIKRQNIKEKIWYSRKRNMNKKRDI